jgi:hypothetical protein
LGGTTAEPEAGPDLPGVLPAGTRTVRSGSSDTFGRLLNAGGDTLDPTPAAGEPSGGALTGGELTGDEPGPDDEPKVDDPYPDWPEPDAPCLDVPDDPDEPDPDVPDPEAGDAGVPDGPDPSERDRSGGCRSRSVTPPPGRPPGKADTFSPGPGPEEEVGEPADGEPGVDGPAAPPDRPAPSFEPLSRAALSFEPVGRELASGEPASLASPSGALAGVPPGCPRSSSVVDAGPPPDFACVSVIDQSCPCGSDPFVRC